MENLYENMDPVSDPSVVVIQLSHDIFWGFRVYLPASVLTLSLNRQIQLINQETRARLTHLFAQAGLEFLQTRARDINVHLHGPLVVNGINYACDHIHSDPVPE